MSTLANRQTIVVGVDGSETSTNAARWAGATADRLGAPLHVVHALPNEGVFYSEAAVLIQAQMLDQLREDGEAIISAVTDLIRADQPRLPIEHSIAPGPAANALLDLADTARTIVIGSTGSGTIENLVMGSTVLRVANHAPCPVIVWRGTKDTVLPDQRPVVVGVDGSELSAGAVAYAFEYASLFGAPLVAVHSWISDRALGTGTATSLLNWDAVAEAETALLSESLAGWQEKYPDVAVTKVTDRGPVARVLAQHSENAQLVVVGSHGRGAFSGALLGSTSQNLLHHATCPTMICRK